MNNYEKESMRPTMSQAANKDDFIWLLSEYIKDKEAELEAKDEILKKKDDFIRIQANCIKKQDSEIARLKEQLNPTSCGHVNADEVFGKKLSVYDKKLGREQ